MEIQDIVFGNEKLHSISMLYGDIYWYFLTEKITIPKEKS